MIMVDKLIENETTYSLSEFTPGKDNIFSDGTHFTEPGIIENIAQTVAARAGYKAIQENQTPDIGFIGAVKRMEILHLPEVNTKITTKVTITSNMGDILVVSGIVTSGNVVIAKGDMNIFIKKTKTD